MDNSACGRLMLVSALWTVVPSGTDGIHHLGVSYTDCLIFDVGRQNTWHSYLGTDTLSCNLLYFANLASVGSLFGECVSKSYADGVGGVVLHMGSQMQQLLLIADVWMDGCDGKLSVGEGASFVEDHGRQIGKDVHEVGTFDENALA